MFANALMPTYAPAEDLVFVRGEGVYLYDTTGKRYLDFGSGVAVNCLGHVHPHLLAALEEQAAKLWHTSNHYRQPGQERLAERLAAISFAEQLFFCNSGAEAWECGLKTVRSYHAHHKTGRFRIITMVGAFHGRTMGAISAAQTAKLTQGFTPLLDGFDQVPLGDLDALNAAITPETAAICLEPILGEGGIIPASKDFLQAVRRLCDAHGLLLYLDEVQTGYGRTGKFFAHEWAGIKPDVLCAAKGIGGGFPLGACLATKKAAIGMGKGSHGSTYGGNPLAMAVGNAVLDVILAPDFLPEVCRQGAALAEDLRALAARWPQEIVGVRGMGLMQGIKTRRPNSEVQNLLRQKGLLVIPASDNVIRLLPPLIITPAQREEAVALLAEAFASLAMSQPADAA
jgi:acetylornithine/N-succinyldiaminopimelate aminotransferase